MFSMICGRRSADLAELGLRFYNDHNEDIAARLTNTLLESQCEVPEFLRQYVHEDGTAHFDDEVTEGAGLAQTDDDNTGDAPAWPSAAHEEGGASVTSNAHETESKEEAQTSSW